MRCPSHSVVTPKLCFPVRHTGLFWRPVLVRNFAFAIFDVRAFSVGRFVCPLTFGGSRVSTLAYAVYTTHVHIPPGCSRYYIPSLGTAVTNNTRCSGDLETFDEFQPFPRMYAHNGQYLFPSSAAQTQNTRCTTAGIQQSHESHECTHTAATTSSPAKHALAKNTRCTSDGIHQSHQSMHAAAGTHFPARAAN